MTEQTPEIELVKPLDEPALALRENKERPKKQDAFAALVKETFDTAHNMLVKGVITHEEYIAYANATTWAEETECAYLLTHIMRRLALSGSVKGTVRDHGPRLAEAAARAREAELAAERVRI